MLSDERILPNVRFSELSVPKGIRISWSEKTEGVPECGFSELNISLKASNFYDLPIRSGFDSIKLNLFLETIFSFFIRCSFILWIICFCCFLYVFYIGNFDELLLELSDVFSFNFIYSDFSFIIFILYIFVLYLFSLIIAFIFKLFIFIQNILYNLTSELKLKILSDNLIIETCGLFKKIKKVFKAEEIKKIYYNKFFDIRIIISTELGDKDYILIYNLPSEYIARFFEQEFERTLNIIDTSFKGEYDFDKKELYVNSFDKKDDNQPKEDSNKDNNQKNNNYNHPFKSIVNFSKYFSFIKNKDTDTIAITKYSSFDEAFKNLFMLFLSGNFIFFMFATTFYYILFLFKSIYFDYIYYILSIFYIGILIIYFVLGYYYYKYRFSNYAISIDTNELISWNINFWGKKILEYSIDVSEISDFRAYECDFSIFRILQNPENSLPHIMKSIRNRQYGYGIVAYIKDGTSKVLIKNIGSSKNAEYLADMLYDLYCKED